MYRMFILLEGKTLEIPVLPSKLAVASPGGNEVTKVIELGDINILNKKGLRELSWESFFPLYPGPYITGSKVLSPIEYVKAIQKQRDARKPVRFLITGTDLDININMGIESFDYEERAGEVGDIYYSIKLKEWKEYTAKRIVISQPTQGEKPVAVVSQPKREGTPPPTKTHTVIKGETLWGIAKKYRGNGADYPVIYEANKAQIDAWNKGKRVNKYTIYPGQVFIIP